MSHLDTGLIKAVICGKYQNLNALWQKDEIFIFFYYNNFRFLFWLFHYVYSKNNLIHFFISMTNILHVSAR